MGRHLRTNINSVTYFLVTRQTRQTVSTTESCSCAFAITSSNLLWPRLTAKLYSDQTYWVRTADERASPPEWDPGLSLIELTQVPPCVSTWRNLKISETYLFIGGVRGETREGSLLAIQINTFIVKNMNRQRVEKPHESFSVVDSMGFLLLVRHVGLFWGEGTRRRNRGPREQEQPKSVMRFCKQI